MQKVAVNLVPEKIFQRLLSAGGTELPPVCAIMGGIVGQVFILLSAIFSFFLVTAGLMELYEGLSLSNNHHINTKPPVLTL